MIKNIKKFAQLVERLELLQKSCEEISMEMHERSEAFRHRPARRERGDQLAGQAEAYRAISESLRQILDSEEKVFHLSSEADYLYL